MKLVFTSTKNLNDGKGIPEITFWGIYKKHKDAVKKLLKVSEKLGIEIYQTWNPNITDSGKIQCGGYEYAYSIVDGNENVVPQPTLLLNTLLE